MILDNAVSAESAINAKCNGIDFCTNTAPSIPEEVYRNLPTLLKELSFLIDEDHKRDVFTVSALPVIAAHLCNVRAFHADGYYTPDLYTLIISDPGKGKGISSGAKNLCKVLNEYIISQSKEERKKYDSLPDKEKASVSPPKNRSLIVPANTSARAIYDGLYENEGSAFIFENEIDTLLSTLSQEWGNVTDILRKAFHHESLSINRKSERYFIDHPRLSMCLSGTFDQFKKMFESAENGHFSRYGLYTFDAPTVWRSHRPTANSQALQAKVQQASNTLFNLYSVLNRREEPLYIDLTAEQWQSIDDTFSGKMEMIEDNGLSKYLHATNNRAAVIALRIISIFTVVRAFQENPTNLKRISISPTAEDMKAGLTIADTLAEHAFRLFYLLPTSSDANAKGERFNKFFAMLPKEFETMDALLIAESMDIPERTAKYWLSSSSEFKRIKRGHYEKV